MSVTAQFRPGTQVIVTDQPGPVSAPTDTDAWFVTGAATRGPIGDYTLIRSLDAFEAVYGERMPSSVLYDCVETFLREGGSRCYVSRVGSDGATATLTLKDSTPADTLKIDARSLGVWGNDLSVAVATSGSGFTISVSTAADGILETSPELDDVHAAAAWAASSSALIEATALAAGTDPAPVAAEPLTGGTDGATAESDWDAALDVFTKNLGPGQISAPGRTTSLAHQALLAHALTRNRFALLDTVDTHDASILQGAAQADRVGGDQDHYGAIFASWAIIQGLAAGTTRQVPWSPVQAGIYARNEHAGASAAQPGAGMTYGRSRSALGLTQVFSDADRDKLTRAGVNTSRADLGVVESYGSRTIVDAAKFPQWREAGQVRLIMAIVARAEAIAEAHLFAILDGRRHEITKFGGELTAMLIPYYEEGSLYGSTPQEAFRVDVGAAVNTEATIANGELRAVLAVRASHMAELVYIEIVKVETTQAL